jgi:hypothetical protein
MKKSGEADADASDSSDTSTALGAALQARIAEDQSLQGELSSDSRDAARELGKAMTALRKLNAKP